MDIALDIKGGLIFKTAGCLIGHLEDPLLAAFGSLADGVQLGQPGMGLGVLLEDLGDLVVLIIMVVNVCMLQSCTSSLESPIK